MSKAASLRRRWLLLATGALVTAVVALSVAWWPQPDEQPPPAAPAPNAPSKPSASPDPGGWPDETNTGVAGCPALTTHTGRLHITESNVTIANRHITGNVTFGAGVRNVTLRCVKVSMDTYFPIDTERDEIGGPGDIRLDRVEVDCGNSAINHAGLLLYGVTVTNGRVYNCMDGYRFGSEVVVQDSLCHNLASRHPDPHFDCSQTSGGDNVVFRHNAFIGRDTSDMLIGCTLGPCDNVLVENNLFVGNPGYLIYVGGVTWGDYPTTNVRIVDNRFSTDASYGPCTVAGPGPAWMGNVTHETGLPLPLRCID